MADQCIVCLDNLETESSGTPQLPAVDAPPEPVVAAIEASKANGTSTTSTTNLDHPNHENHDPVALIQICGHVLHDSCLREWTEKANSCPICRQAFHLVHVYDKIGGMFVFVGVVCANFLKLRLLTIRRYMQEPFCHPIRLKTRNKWPSSTPKLG